MPDQLRDLLQDPGPHSAESLGARLPDFPIPAIRDALEALTAQGVLEREEADDGTPLYRYVAPERYAQANLEVIRNPGTRESRRRSG